MEASKVAESVRGAVIGLLACLRRNARQARKADLSTSMVCDLTARSPSRVPHLTLQDVLDWTKHPWRRSTAHHIRSRAPDRSVGRQQTEGASQVSERGLQRLPVMNGAQTNSNTHTCPRPPCWSERS